MVCPAPRSHGAPRRALTGAVRISAGRCVLNGKTRLVPNPLQWRVDARRQSSPRRGGRPRRRAPTAMRWAPFVHCCQCRADGLLLVVGVLLVALLVVVRARLEAGLVEVGQLLLDVALEPRAVVALEGA